MWEQNEKSPGGRQKNSDLVNSIVVRDEKGGYKLDLHNPYVEEAIVVFEERYMSDKAVGLIKAVMVAKCGGREGFEDAKARGDIHSEVDDAGKEKWFYPVSEKVRKVGWRDTSTTNMGARKIDGKKAVCGW